MSGFEKYLHVTPYRAGPASPAPDLARVGDTVVATFRPAWENRGGDNYTITGVVWQQSSAPFKLMVGYTPLAGAVRVDVVETAS